MPFTRPGSDIEMATNPNTGRLDFSWDSSGNPVYSDTQSHRVASLLVERRGQWVQDKTGQRGSVLHLIRSDRARTASEIESAAGDALEKAVREGYIQPNPKVMATRTRAGVFRAVVLYKTQDGTARTVEV